MDALVSEFLAAQSLKVLPQGEFADAIHDFVEKDDKNAMDTFVATSLTDALKSMLTMDGIDEKNLDEAMERWKKGREERYAAGQVKRQKRILRPRPNGWDSDAEGHWEDQPGVWEAVPDSANQSLPVDGSSRGRQSSARHDDSDDFMDDFEDEPMEAAPAKRTTAARSTKSAAPAKKTAAPTKAPARGRGKKSALLEDSDEDMFLDDDDEDPVIVPPAKKQPTRASAAAKKTAAAPAKRQTTLSFSQSQRATQRGAQKAVEISDDEISEDDAFESMPVTRSRRR